MYTEYFTLESYLTKETYAHCYKPQQEMRICMQCYGLYLAVIMVVLTGSLALDLQESAIRWLATKIVNISALLFGPLAFSLCLVGFYRIKDLSSVCTLQGIQHEFNGVCIYLLFFMTLVSLLVCYLVAV